MPNGRVIEISTAAPPPRAAGAAKVEINNAGSWAPSWKAGHASLRAEATHAAVVGAAPPRSFNLAPLSARHFCSGHVYWLQQRATPGECASVHTTFTEGGYDGKIWRFREAALWLMDPPDYFSGRFLTFTPPQPPATLPPARNASAPTAKNDKYNAGWLVPDALRMSPRLRAHLELVRRHVLATRDAMALAAALKRTLVLPRYPCLCDRSEGPNIIETCTYEGSDLTLPFVCPLSHIFDLYRFRELGARAGRLAAARQPPPRLDIQLREHAFLTNPLRPPAAPDAAATLAVARNASAAAALRAAGVPYIVDGASDAQARAAEALFQLRDKELVHLESSEGVFGGWADAEDAREFEMLMARHVMGLSWCCTSWYKPSGTFPYADPPPTAVLPKRCGEGDAAAAAARPECAALQAKRRAAQRPFDFNYVRDGGKDGYYVLRPRFAGGPRQL